MLSCETGQSGSVKRCGTKCWVCFEREVARPSPEAWLRDVRANDPIPGGPSSAELVKAGRDEECV